MASDVLTAIGESWTRGDQVLIAGRFTLRLNRPLIMGVVNVTPDSFSDGGQYVDAKRAVEHAHALIDEGADILDIGGESTRPGAAEVPESQELDRVLPVIDALANVPVPISIDTSKPGVMCAAHRAGAAIINDVFALRLPGAIEAAAQTDCAICLMHMRGDPRTMQDEPQYQDVVAEVGVFLAERAALAQGAGIKRERLIIDPGYGFGKNKYHNRALLRGLPELRRLGLPILAGLSRKSWLGRVTGRPVEQRVHASVASALAAVSLGAAIVRVHDVAATRDAIAVWEATFNKEFRFYDQ